MADPMASSTSISRTAAEDEEERDLETGQPQQASQSQPQQQEQQEEEDRVIPADEEEEEGNEEEKQDKEKDGSGSPLRGSEYDGEAISLPHEAGGGEEAAIGVAAGLCGVFDEEEDEDPLVALTREQCLAVLRKAFYIVVPLSLVASVFACLYGWVYVNSQRYSTDPGAWQRCMIYNVGQANATPQNFAVSASAFGGVVFIFMGLGFKAGYLGLHDPNLLPYSLCVTTYTLLGQLLYRPVNPVVPAITELTPTLASLAYFIRPSMYDSVPPVVPGGPPNPCDTAYRINAAFLAFQFVILAANVLNFGVQIYAALKLRKTPRPQESQQYQLVWHKPALVLAALAVMCYLGTIAAKEDAALQTLFLLREVKRAYLFPFVRPALDTVGLFMLLTVASVVYGACKGEPESFKWAAFTAYVHVLLSYPIVIANFQAYHLYDFWTTSGCRNFLEHDTTHAGGQSRMLLFTYAALYYPEKEERFCLDTRVALIGQFLQFVCMHLAIPACLLVVAANWAVEKPSMRLFGGQSKASSLLFPNPPQLDTSSHAPPTAPSGLQEPLLSPTASGGGTSTAFRRAHHRRVSSQVSLRSHGSQQSVQQQQRSRASSLHNHLLGPVLD